MESWKYNPKEDYVAAINRYNECVNSGKNEEAITIARRFGGLIPLCANASKQKEARAKSNK